MTVHAAMLQTIVEESRDLVAAVDHRFRLVACNRAFRQEFEMLTGRMLAEGDDLRAALAEFPAIAAPFIALWTRALAGETFETEHEFDADGESRCHHIRFMPIHDADGAVIGASQMGRDITPRKRLEQQIRRVNQELVRRVAEKTSKLRQTEDRFRALVERAPVGIAQLDLTGRFLSVNRCLSEITGYTPAELLATTFQAITHPDDLADDLSLAQRMTAGEFDNYRMEKRYVRKDGSQVWVMLTGGIVRDDPPYYIAVVEDISERKVAEEKLRTAKAEAERANQSKSRFLAAASHDLRQPAQSLALFASVLEMRLEGTPEALVVERLQQSMDGLRTLLDALADVSKLDAGLVSPTIADVPLDQLLARLARDYTPHAQAVGLNLRRVHTNAVVRSDPDLLERILRNLLDNAIRYTPAGDILIGCRRRGDHVSVEVIDTGIGIPADHAEAVFEDFHQVGNPARDRSQGLGLGLAIVRRLATLLGHDVRLDTVVGSGSRFSLGLPAAQLPQLADPPAEFSAGPAKRLDGENRTVVVVDDEELVRVGLGLMLESWGYRVVSCRDGSEAQRAVAARRPDVIIADYRLADGEIGTQVVEKLRGILGGWVPAVVLTGDTAPERVAEASSSGVGILHKPVGAESLRNALNRLLT